MKNIKTIFIKRQNNILFFLLLCLNVLNSCSQHPLLPDGITLLAQEKYTIVWFVIWSPVDPNQLLVTSINSVKSTSQVFILDLATMTENLILETPADSLGPGAQSPRIEGIDWSPDGKSVSILLFSESAGYKPGLMIWNIEKRTSEYLDWDERAIWSPDGDSMAFFTERPPTLHVVNVITKQDKILYSEGGHITDGYSSGFSWSPDSESIVFSMGNSSKRDLFIVYIGIRQVTKIQLTGNNAYPVWSPRGGLIAYEKGYFDESENSDKYAYYLSNVSGTCDTPIPNTEGAGDFTWSPDGKRAAYVSYGNIYILDFQEVFKGDIYQTVCR